MAAESTNNNLEAAVTVSVAIDKCLYPFDFLYDYYVPASLENKISVGQTVMVPFGKGNQARVAMVYRVERKRCDVNKLKPVLSLSQNGIKMTREHLELSEWLKETTFCTYFDAVKTMLPPGLNFSVRAKYSLAWDNKSRCDLSQEESIFLNELKAAKTEKQLEIMLGCLNSDKNIDKKKIAQSLLKKGFIVKKEEIERQIGDRTEQMVRLRENFQQNDRMTKLTPKQRAVINTLAEYESASVGELCYICGITPAVIKNLVKYGILEEYRYQLTRAETANARATGSPDNIILSEEQQKAYDRLENLMTEEKPKCALLHGVTGSGKTSVFIKLIDKAIKLGKTALMLVPEISLTPQTVKSFQELFGNNVAIIHSALSMGQRADEYKRIKGGDAKIVIGTRSAVFAPLENIGIIVIDEEGEHTYKSDRTPRYNAVSVAKQRCFKHNSLLLLASATPSLSSRYFAQIGRYEYVPLTRRYNKGNLPEVYMVDMKAEYESGNRGNFSQALLHEIQINLQKGEQSLILLNRRGYHTHISCIKCGEVMKCPNCDLPLTYHKANETICCHYCGYTKKIPDVCPKCHSRYITQSGTGTQRIEDEIKQYFPKARVLRMDADTTMSRDAFSKRFSEFGRGDYDIMVGTQMIAKGLDFENVTLVGVLGIDKSLYMGDYLGYEQTFSLITQVVGRSGRGGKTGRAYLQTFSPDHYVLQLAAKQDYEEFYRQEIEVRQALLFPPFCDICMVGFTSILQQQCENGARRFLTLFKERLDREKSQMPLRVLGPTKLGTGKLGGRYRYKLIIKCKFNKKFRSLLGDVLTAAYKDRELGNVSFYVDVNGFEK